MDDSKIKEEVVEEVSVYSEGSDALVVEENDKLFIKKEVELNEYELMTTEDFIAAKNLKLIKKI